MVKPSTKRNETNDVARNGSKTVTLLKLSKGKHVDIPVTEYRDVVEKNVSAMSKQVERERRLAYAATGHDLLTLNNDAITQLNLRPPSKTMHRFRKSTDDEKARSAAYRSMKDSIKQKKQASDREEKKKSKNVFEP
eukprot:GHVH01006577.1.p1 GENE.GHVH01006577.1~~GHVH01006577.1.p1  ORF type:complete len:136 (+),score=32.48 GHVH01006577.1:61-468(+)